MATMTAKIGEQLTWLRQSEALKCTVTKIFEDGRVALRIEGWASTDVVRLNDYEFKRGHNWRLWKGELRQVGHADA